MNNVIIIDCNDFAFYYPFSDHFRLHYYTYFERFEGEGGLMLSASIINYNNKWVTKLYPFFNLVLLLYEDKNYVL